MNPLEQIIIGKIKKEGPITFKTFMEMALYYPELGYYSSPETTIGREGDFYTSPHLHHIFGAMIGKQLMEMWMIMDRPSLFHTVEIGAGLGYLCKDILDYLCKSSEDSSLAQDKSEFLKSLKYVIVEPYSHFEERQRKLLNNLLKNPPSPPIAHEGDKLIEKNITSSPQSEKEMKRNITINWVKSLDELDDVIGCIFSNELLDAFPVHIIEMDSEPKEVYINHDGNKFREEINNLSTDEITNYIKEFIVTHLHVEASLREESLQPDPPLGTSRFEPSRRRRGYRSDSIYRTEINLGIRDWLKGVSTVLSQGFLLTIDYGYTAREFYSDERTKGTLLCYHKHLFNEDPYQNIGEQDITAHINFSSLRKWGEDLGLKTVGYCPQGTFLIAAGIDEVITELYSGSHDYLSEVSKIKGLIMPQGMGESHSVMIQHKGEGLPEFRGFSMRNQVQTL